MNQLQQTLSSNEVAGMIGTTNGELMKSIRTYIGYLAEGEIPSGDFFIESTYKDSNNQERPNYLLTKQGCEMVSNKLTGSKGVQFTAKYVSRFNKMEEHIKSGQSKQIDSDMSDLDVKRMNATARLMNATSRQAKMYVDMSKDATTEVNKALLQDKAVEVLNGEKLLEMPTLRQHLFDSDQIAEKVGVYSKNGKPHGTAISQLIKREILVEDDEFEIVPEATNHWGGSVTKYAESVVEKVKAWLEAHNYPAKIKGNKMDYHVRYEF